MMKIAATCKNCEVQFEFPVNVELVQKMREHWRSGHDLHATNKWNFDLISAVARALALSEVMGL